MRSIIYKIALFAVIVCVFVILVAPDIDLPDSTVLRVKDGFHLVVITVEVCVSLLLLVVAAFGLFMERKSIGTRFDAPSNPFLCTFLC